MKMISWVNSSYMQEHQGEFAVGLYKLEENGRIFVPVHTHQTLKLYLWFKNRDVAGSDGFCLINRNTFGWVDGVPLLNKEVIKEQDPTWHYAFATDVLRVPVGIENDSWRPAWTKEGF